MPVLKNPRHELFAQELATGKTADDAYASAGFKPNRGNAARLNANESIQKRVAEILERGAAKAETSVAHVLSELTRLGFSDIRKAFTEHGSILPPAEWDDEFAAAVAGIEVVSRNTNEKDDEGRTVIEHVHKIKLWDKNSALEKLAKHLGMFIERQEITGRVEIKDVSPRDRIAGRIARLASRQ